MRLTDIVTPEILEKAIHWPIPSDPAEEREQEKRLAADQKERLQATLPLMKVLAHCLRTCGPQISASMEDQVKILHLNLAAIDAAIDLATRESV